MSAGRGRSVKAAKEEGKVEAARGTGPPPPPSVALPWEEMQISAVLVGLVSANAFESSVFPVLDDKLPHRKAVRNSMKALQGNGSPQKRGSSVGSSSSGAKQGKKPKLLATTARTPTPSTSKAPPLAAKPSPPSKGPIVSKVPPHLVGKTPAGPVLATIKSPFDSGPSVSPPPPPPPVPAPSSAPVTRMKPNNVLKQKQQATTSLLLEEHKLQHEQYSQQYQAASETVKAVQQQLLQTEGGASSLTLPILNGITVPDLDRPVANRAPKTNIHNAEGKVKRCHICGRGFNKTTYLKRHILSHSSVKPFKCQICGWGFYQYCNLKRHMTSHSVTGGDGFKCNHCEATFSTKSVLSVHMRDAHGDKVSIRRGSTGSAGGNNGAQASNGQQAVDQDRKVSVGKQQSMLKPLASVNTSTFDSAEVDRKPPVVITEKGEPSKTAKEAPAAVVGNKLYKCTLCQATFDKVSLLNKHIRTHSAEVTAHNAAMAEMAAAK